MSDSESDNPNSEIPPSDSEQEEEASHHAASLQRLKDKDPDFYEFLKENDKGLLDFKADDDDDASMEEEDQDESGESEVEEEDDTPKHPISKPKLSYIKEHIREKPTIKLCKELIAAFKSAVQQAEGTDKKTSMAHSEHFNDVMKLCLIELTPALQKVLKLGPGEGKKKPEPKQSKLWKKIQVAIKGYLIDMLKMYSIMKDPSISALLLKHTINLIPFFLPFVKLSRILVKKMIALWCSDEETVRVLSLIIIVRTTKSFPKEYLGQILKAMYFAYIKNTKFTSVTTWPMINFMKRSLTEVYSLNPELVYEHGFIYIRQMSIHLRNALTTKRKESQQTVYSWQYVHCILLWSNLLCRHHEHEAIKGLIYPLVQTTIGTLNLLPIAKFVPLRFHLVRCLMQISESTDTFIPVLPFVLDVLTIMDYNKRSSFSIKPVDFTCALKVTKSQQSEIGFKEACITEVCNVLVGYFKIYASSIGFPELALPAVIQIKSFIKKCKVAKFNQLLKGVLVKIEENAAFIAEKRRPVSFALADIKEVKKWEEDIQKFVPLMQDNKGKDSVKVDDSPAVPTKKNKHAKNKGGSDQPSKKRKNFKNKRKFNVQAKRRKVETN